MQLWFGRTYFPVRVNVSVVNPITHLPEYQWALADGCGEQHPKTVIYAPNASADAPPPPSAAVGSECVYVQVAPHQTSGWVDVGRMMDTLDHSSLYLPVGNYSLKLGVKVNAQVLETVQDRFITPLYQQHASHTLASRAYGPQPHMRS